MAQTIRDLTQSDLDDIAIYLDDDRREAIHGMAETADEYVRAYAAEYGADDLLQAARLALGEAASSALARVLGESE